MNKASCNALLVGVALGAAASACAQSIELSSESIGTVRVTPPAMGAGGHPAIPAPRDTRSRGSANARTGVDLGIKRRADGSLYDALDPNQNPAAATAPGGTTAPARTGVPPAEGSNAASGNLAATGSAYGAPSGTPLPPNANAEGGNGAGATAGEAANASSAAGRARSPFSGGPAPMPGGRGGR